MVICQRQCTELRTAVSTVRQELRRLTGRGLIAARKDGNRTYYQANTQHPLYVDIRNLVLTSVRNSPRLFVLGNDDDLAAMGG